MLFRKKIERSCSYCIYGARLEDGVHNMYLNNENRVVIVDTVSYTGWKMISVIPGSAISIGANSIKYYILVIVALLTMMIAKECGLEAGKFIHTLGDAHLYLNHLEQADEQLSREPRALPRMKINPDVKSIFEYKYEDFELEGYDPHPTIKAPLSF